MEPLFEENDGEDVGDSSYHQIKKSNGNFNGNKGNIDVDTEEIIHLR